MVFGKGLPEGTVHVWANDYDSQTKHTIWLFNIAMENHHF